jgi:O-antigen/teichoic acid export membrane protein
MEFSQYLSFRSIITFSGLNYLQSALSFFTSLLLAKELGSYEYGYFTYGLIFANTISVIIQFGLDKTLVRDLVQQSDVEKILYAASFLKLVLSIVSVAGIAIWALFFSGMDSTKLYVVILCTISGCLLGLSPKAWFDIKGRIQAHAYIMLLDRVIFFFGSMFFLYYLRNEYIIINVCVCMLLGRLVMSAMEWKYIRTSAGNMAFERLGRFLKQVFSNNLWVWLAAIGNLMMTHFNQILVDVQMGAEQLGFYGFAFQLITMVKILQNQILRLSTPSISEIVDKAGSREIMKSFLKNLGISFFSTLIILLPSFLLAPWFVSTFVGAGFMDTIPIFNVLCLWVSVFGVALIANQFLLSFHLQKSYFYITIAFGLLSIYLAYIWIDQFGAVGAALSLLVAHTGSIIVQILLVIRQIKKNVRTA